MQPAVSFGLDGKGYKETNEQKTNKQTICSFLCRPRDGEGNIHYTSKQAINKLTSNKRTNKQYGVSFVDLPRDGEGNKREIGKNFTDGGERTRGSLTIAQIYARFSKFQLNICKEKTQRHK